MEPAFYCKKTFEARSFYLIDLRWLMLPPGLR